MYDSTSSTRVLVLRVQVHSCEGLRQASALTAALQLGALRAVLCRLQHPMYLVPGTTVCIT